MGLFFVALGQVRSGQPPLDLEGKFPPNIQNFQFLLRLRSKHISSGRVKKYPGQSSVGLLFTAIQKYARVSFCLFSRDGPTRAYFWPAVNKRPTWVLSDLTQSNFFDPKRKELKNSNPNHKWLTRLEPQKIYPTNRYCSGPIYTKWSWHRCWGLEGCGFKLQHLPATFDLGLPHQKNFQAHSVPFTTQKMSRGVICK